MVDLFLKSMQVFASQDVSWWTGVTCGLLWCVYQLFVLSFWRHPCFLIGLYLDRLFVIKSSHVICIDNQMVIDCWEASVLAPNGEHSAQCQRAVPERGNRFIQYCLWAPQSGVGLVLALSPLYSTAKTEDNCSWTSWGRADISPDRSVTSFCARRKTVD